MRIFAEIDERGLDNMGKNSDGCIGRTALGSLAAVDMIKEIRKADFDAFCSVKRTRQLFARFSG